MPEKFGADKIIREEEIEKIYLSHRKDRTWKHVREVAETAAEIARRYGLNIEKIRTAALLHDVSAILSPQEMFDLAVTRKMPLDPSEEKYHFLLHQRISRILAEEQLGIRDPEILDAVECHTTLKKSAGSYDKVLFIADKISWDQEGVPPHYETLQTLVRESLDKACFFYISDQFENGRLLMPHKWTIEAYDDLKSRIATPQ